MSPRVSIIIVNYHSQKLLQACVKSIQTKIPHEIIIEDNDETSAHGNIGFGAANNLGAHKARGKYLFFLNPDTLILPGAIKKLVEFLETHPQAAIAAPLLLDPNKDQYPQVGSHELTPLQGILSHSFINKIWPRHGFWIETKNLTQATPAAVVPGTAFIIRKSVFDQIGGFDPRFFLYFEESDLCRRVCQLNHQIYLLPEATIVHYWGRSTPKTARIKNILATSRFYYFQKHFGLPSALLVEFFCRLSKEKALLLAAILIGTFLRFVNLSQNLTLIDDQAWFYLSARDALIYGKFPLLGITASITWLHQGPLYTFMLMPSFIFSNFSPIAPAYFTGLFTSLNIILLYFLAAKLFNRTAGLVAAVIFAFHPFIVLQSRFPYHTTPVFFFIPIFFLLFLKNRLFLAGLFLGFLYQLHLLTFIFWVFIKPKMLPGFLLGILPFIFVGPVQTFGIFAWIVKHLFTGFSGSSISGAYQVVLSIPIILSISFLISHFSKKWAYLLTLFIILYSLFNQSFPRMTGFQDALKNPAQNEYVSWWLSRR